jgi:hypothetical protein
MSLPVLHSRECTNPENIVHGTYRGLFERVVIDLIAAMGYVGSSALLMAGDRSLQYHHCSNQSECRGKFGECRQHSPEKWLVVIIKTIGSGLNNLL